jgi:hypothetical protein
MIQQKAQKESYFQLKKSPIWSDAENNGGLRRTLVIMYKLNCRAPNPPYIMDNLFFVTPLDLQDLRKNCQKA